MSLLISIFNESPFWLGGHGSLLVFPASVVFHWMSLEISLLHLFCSVFDRQIRHKKWFWKFENNLNDQISFIFYNIDGSYCYMVLLYSKSSFKMI